MPRIAVITDLHWPSVTERSGSVRHGDQALLILDEFFRAAKNEHADLTVNLGDTIASCCTLNDRQSIHKKLIDSPVPLYNIAGNNEFKANSGNGFPDVTGLLAESESLDIGGLHLVFFRPSVDVVNLALPDISEDLKWLSSDLEQTQCPTVIFSHVPLFRPHCDLGYSENLPPPDSLLFYPNQEELRETIQAHPNVVGLVSGHLHRDVLEVDEEACFCLCVQSATQGGKSGPDRAFGIIDFNLQEASVTISRHGKNGYTQTLSLRAPSLVL